MMEALGKLHPELVQATYDAALDRFAVLRFRWSQVVFLCVIAGMMIPMPSIIVPEFVNLARIGWINHYYGAIVVYAALGAPFATFLMTTYFRRVPEEVLEAALIDGLGYGRIFFQIMLPLALPAMATIAVLQFIYIWDDLLVGLLFLQTPEVRPITVGLATIPHSTRSTCRCSWPDRSSAPSRP